jgi:hypothetical protein
MSPHPLEALRYVARSWEIGDEFPAQEVASVLAELACDNPASLLQACRRLIEYFPASGRAWWLSARALSAADPVEGIWDAASELAEDPTLGLLVQALPESAPVALASRSGPLARALRRRQEAGPVRKAARAEIVVVQALAAAPTSLLVTERSSSAAASALNAARELWAVVERGVLLPEALWEQVLVRATAAGGVAVLGASSLSVCVSSYGKSRPTEALARPTCPAVAELLGWKS